MRCGLNAPTVKHVRRRIRNLIMSDLEREKNGNRGPVGGENREVTRVSGLEERKGRKE